MDLPSTHLFTPEGTSASPAPVERGAKGNTPAPAVEPLRSREQSDATVEPFVVRYQAAIRAAGYGSPTAGDIRDVLTARESLSRAIQSTDVIYGELIERIATMDRECRLLLKRSLVGAEQMTAWREASGADPTSWWWSSAVRLPLSRLHAALNGVAWLSISVALTALIQLSRRIVATDEFWGVIVQSYFALLVTGTIMQFARDAVMERSAKSPLMRTTISTCVLAFLLLLFAFLAVPQVRKLAVLKSNDALWAKERGDFAASVDLYEQAVRLDPENAVTHYNLAKAAESVADYDLADREFRAAIRFDRSQKLYNPWFGAAKLALIQHHDPRMALRFLARGADVSSRGGGGVSRDVDYALGKYRGWAYLEMKEL
ncbi:MAG: hypothetical protein QOE68_2873, partial [Thermoanaerobaculia bacterium]|nr:hypothetical protein [Thermoanaerobaculia bacterium]